MRQVELNSYLNRIYIRSYVRNDATGNDVYATDGEAEKTGPEEIKIPATSRRERT